MRSCSGNFLVECGFQTPSRNTRMTFRVGPDPDLLDAGLTQASFLDNCERVGKSPWRIDVATDHQQPPHVGVAAQARQQFLQIRGARKSPRRDVNDGFEPGFTQ